MTDDARRSLPRLSFAGRIAPKLETALQSFDVVDLSPEGMRIRTGSNGVTIGEVLHAVIRFPADRSVEVEGRVLRVSGMEAALVLERGQDRIARTGAGRSAEPPPHGIDLVARHAVAPRARTLPRCLSVGPSAPL